MKSKKKVLRKTSYYEPLHADPSWLYPIILPSIFPTLFALYKEHYSRDDFKIGRVISRLDQRSDEELSEILGVRRYILLTLCAVLNTQRETIL